MSDLTKDWTDLMNGSSSLNVTLMFLHGLSGEEQEVFLQINKLQLQIKDMRRVVLQEKNAHTMLSVDTVHLQETKTHGEADSLREEIALEKQRQEELKNEFTSLELEKERHSLEAARAINPKIYSLKKKLLEFKELCHKRKRDLDKIELEKKHIGTEYVDIISSIKAEEGIRSRIARLENEVKEKDTSIINLRDEYSKLSNELTEYENDLQERKYASKLLDSYQSLSGAVSDSRKEVAVLKNQFKDLEDELAIKKKAPAQANSEDVRTEIRRLEKQLLEMDKQLTEKQKIKKKILIEHKDITAKLQEAKKHAKSPPPKPTRQVSLKAKSPVMIVGTPNSGLASYKICLSPRQMEMSRTPGVFSRRSKGTSARRPKLNAEQQEALKTIRDVGKAEDAIQAVYTLTGYGNSTESLPEKIIKLNRALLQKPPAKP